MADLHFLPYLRRGLARHVEEADPGAGAIGPAGAAMSVVIAGAPIGTTVTLLAPHHVMSIAPSEIVGRYPAPDAIEVEPNYFPLIELAAPDLPWRFSPAAPGLDGRLRPWIALVVVEADADGVDYTITGDGTARLTVDASQRTQLPPIDDVWAWAHVQSLVQPAEVPAAAEHNPASLRSRLVCPRRLDPGVTYRAALVNVFAEGEGQQSVPAWSNDGGDGVTLTVYDSWTFTTSTERVNFELLCERLLPATKGGALGIRRVDVSRPGIPVDWPRRGMSIDLVGVLADVSVISDAPPEGTSAFADAVVPMLNETLDRVGEPVTPADYDPLEHDPVVGLPFYASFPAAVARVPRDGWARDLNVRVDARIAAGLGAKTVRRTQESLMAAAWDQLGQVREVSDELNRGRLSAEVGRVWQARLAAVDAGDRVAIAAPLLTYVRVDGTPARRVLAGSRAPVAVLDRAWLRRATRVRAASAATAFLAGTRRDASARDRLAFRYQSIASPKGIKGIEEQLAAELDSQAGKSPFTGRQLDWLGAHHLATTVGGARLDQFVRAQIASVRPIVTRPTDPTSPIQPIGPTRPGRPPFPRRPPRSAVRSGEQVSVTGRVAFDIARAVTAMSPLLTTRDSLVARIPVLGELLPAGELPAALSLAPQFTDPLFWDLAAFDPDILVPGLEDFANNRVRLLAVNGAFVAAYLAGANHEMAREFLWREYPADLAATFFRRFFDYADADTTDIAPIAGWPRQSSLSKNVLNAAAGTVVLIRADLVRRYPDVNIFIAPQRADGTADYGRAVQPGFEGRLSSDVLVVGFPVAPEVVLGRQGGAEYFVVLEERVTSPRFGLDVERTGVLDTWDELAWTDFDAALTHIGPAPIEGLGSQEIDRVVWGRNAAHMAAAVHRRPFRRAYPASRLIG